MLNKLYDYITAKITADYYVENSVDQAPYLGEAYFPATSVDDLSTKWILGSESAPVAVVAANLDTDPLKRDREGFEAKEAELIFFREAFSLTEKQRLELEIAYKLGTEQFNRALARTFDDVSNLIKGSRASLEKMRMEFLATGKIAIKENGVDKLLDYGLKDSQFLTLDFTKPITALKKARKSYYDLNNEYPEDLIISGSQLDAWLETAEVKELTKNVILSRPSLGFDRDSLAEVVGRELGLNILINDKKYLTARSKVSTRFYPEDRFTLLPHREIGETVFGLTPEMLDNEYVDATVVETGICISTQETTHSPLKKDTVVSFNALPSAPLANKIMIVKAKASE